MWTFWLPQKTASEIWIFRIYNRFFSVFFVQSQIVAPFLTMLIVFKHIKQFVFDSQTKFRQIIVTILILNYSQFDWSFKRWAWWGYANALFLFSNDHKKVIEIVSGSKLILFSLNWGIKNHEIPKIFVRFNFEAQIRSLTQKTGFFSLADKTSRDCEVERLSEGMTVLLKGFQGCRQVYDLRNDLDQCEWFENLN